LNAPTQDNANWHSASEDVGFATPAYENSQALEETGEEDAEVYLEPLIFSPDHDGFEDFLTINYRFEKGGYTATIIIYDARGKQIRILQNNSLLATEGFFKWDGLTEEGSKLRPGIYIVYMKAFEPNGTIKVFKKVVTLASKY
ncbi:MAG: gliding motility-associated C-terminal domain-containing protein, partial [Bacteroidota bacterium]|nr:gliding motility-associated C-terminal domain-containing protein [Bacteroidota bacterium]